MGKKPAKSTGVAKVVDPYDTNEKKIIELRKQRAAKLYVRPDFIDALLEEYDIAINYAK